MSETHATTAELDCLCTWIEARIESLAADGDSYAINRCEADRRRLERHRPVNGGRRFEDKDVLICGHCSHDEEWKAVMAPCDDLLDLAHSYSIERDDWYVE
jgi:hypothetical protein